MQFDSPSTVDTRHFTGAVSPSYPAKFESAAITVPSCGCRGRVNYAEPKLNTCVCYSVILLSDLTVFNRKMRKPDPVTQVKRSSSGGFLHAAAAATAQAADVPMITERRRKSRPRLPVDDDEESDGAQADEEPLAGSRVRTGMANVDTRRRSAVVTTTSLIEDDEGRRHSMLV